MFHDLHDRSSFEPMPDSPHHGYQGDREAPAPRPRLPASLTIAISREAGARGTSIARRLGEQLGWQVYTQDLLEYSAQDELARQDILDALTAEAAAWVDEQLCRWQSSPYRAVEPSVLDLFRILLALGARGEVILIGRGAGHLLPRATTLHVRLVAPLAERIAYLSQWQRLTEEEAARQVQLRDQGREQFIESHFGLSPGDTHLYDMVLNTGCTGEELAAHLIHEAARHRLTHLFSPLE